MNNIVHRALIIGVGLGIMAISSLQVGAAETTTARGSITIESSACTIPLNYNQCGVKVSWSVTDPVSGQTRMHMSSFGGYEMYQDSYSNTFWNPAGENTVTYTLKNNGVVLDTKTVTSSCVSGSEWNGARCVQKNSTTATTVAMIEASDCTIAATGIGCGSQVTWNSPAGTKLTWCGFVGGIFVSPCNEYVESPKNITGNGSMIMQVATYGAKLSLIDATGAVLASKNIKGICGWGSEDKRGVCTCGQGTVLKGGVCTLLEKSTITSFSGTNTSGNVTLKWVSEGTASCSVYRYSQFNDGLTGDPMQQEAYKQLVASNLPPTGEYKKKFVMTAANVSAPGFETFKLECGSTSAKTTVNGTVTPAPVEYVSGGGSATACTLEAKMCADGSFVGRNANNNCAFNACPTTVSTLPYTVPTGTTMPYQTVPGTTGSSVTNPVTSGTICTMEAKMCDDGSFVSRNQNNNCAFDACPTKVSGTTKPGTSVTACTLEARLCADGKVMQRNSATCEWIPSSCGSSTGTGVNGGDIDPNGSTGGMCLNLTTDLRQGTRNTSVESLQDFLITANYLNAEATGYFGALTFRAVQAYQASKGLTQSGFVGPLTRAAVYADTCTRTSN